jgi:GntR family transcriptional regulator, transcriptional repressor for pyruvate dehydrogenase complex
MATTQRPAPRTTRTTVTRQVVDALYQMLRSGRYREGDRLPSEWQLVGELGVGRSAIREAIRELVTLDLIELRPGRGTYVRSLRPDLLLRQESFGDLVDTAVKRDLLEVRRIIEPEAAALMSQRATQAEIDRLQEDIERLGEAINVGYRPPEDLGFHLDIVRATHNASLARLAGAIVSFYERDSVLPNEQDLLDHGAIYEAIRERDADEARRLMRQHLDNNPWAREPSDDGHAARGRDRSPGPTRSVRGTSAAETNGAA